MKTQRFHLSRFDRVVIGDIAYQPVETTDDCVHLMRLDGTGTVERVDHARLAAFRTKPDWQFNRNWFLPAGTRDAEVRPPDVQVSALSAEKQDYLAWQLNVVTVMHEMHTNGTLALSNDGTDAKKSLITLRVNEREIARQQIGQSLRAGKKVTIRQLPSTRTILRLYRKYARAGYRIDPLIPRARTMRVPGQVDYEAEELLRDCILAYASPERLSKTQVFESTKKRFEEENQRRAKAGLQQLKIYSRRTVDRRIDRLDPFYLACHRLGLDRARAMFATSGAGLPKLFPMQRIEFDEWRVDVRTWFAKLGILERLPPEIRDSLPSGRRWVCAAIDAATRCILGVRIAEAPSSSEAIRLLRLVVQDKTDLARAVGSKSDWPYFGGLCEVAADGGPAFQSTDFISAVTDLHGNIHFPPVGIPELRGIIERFFGTITTRLMPLLSGRTFRGPDARGDYDSKARTVLDDGDLLRIIVKWIVDDYHHSPHAGLGGDSPAAKWKRLAEERFVPEPPDAHTRRTALGIEVERTLGKQGVQFATNFYSSAELRDKFRHSRQRRFRIRIDPDDIGAISVLVDGRWSYASCINGDLHGVTLDAWKLQVALINQRYRDQAQLSQSIRDEAIDSIRATNAQRVAQLLPGSLTTTAAQIDALERTDFAGKSWQPTSDSAPHSAKSAFGTLILPAETPRKVSIRDDDTTSPPVDQPNTAHWSLDDD